MAPEVPHQSQQVLPHGSWQWHSSVAFFPVLSAETRASHSRQVGVHVCVQGSYLISQEHFKIPVTALQDVGFFFFFSFSLRRQTGLAGYEVDENAFPMGTYK